MTWTEAKETQCGALIASHRHYGLYEPHHRKPPHPITPPPQDPLFYPAPQCCPCPRGGPYQLLAVVVALQDAVVGDAHGHHQHVGDGTGGERVHHDGQHAGVGRGGLAAPRPRALQVHLQELLLPEQLFRVLGGRGGRGGGEGEEQDELNKGFLQMHE